MQQPEVLTIYRGHREWVSTLSWLPDGRHIVSGSADGTVQLWESESGKNMLTYDGHSLEVTALAWSPDEQFFLCQSLGSVEIWEACSNTCVYHSPRQMYKINAMSWSPDGTRIAFGGHNKTVVVWNVAPLLAKP